MRLHQDTLNGDDEHDDAEEREQEQPEVVLVLDLLHDVPVERPEGDGHLLPCKVAHAVRGLRLQLLRQVLPRNPVAPRKSGDVRRKKLRNTENAIEAQQAGAEQSFESQEANLPTHVLQGQPMYSRAFMGYVSRPLLQVTRGF